MAQTKKANNKGAWSPTLGMMAVMLGVALLVGGLVAGWWYMQKNTGTIAYCAPGNLQLEAGQQSGAAGTIYQRMNIKNTGNVTCQIGGYPTAFLYGGDGYAVGAGAAATPQPAPVSILLAAGQSAYTTLGYPQAGNFNPGVCSAKSTQLQLYAPGTTVALTTPLQVAWCPGFSSTAMQIGS